MPQKYNVFSFFPHFHEKKLRINHSFPDFGTFFCHRIAGIDNQHFNFFLWVNLGESRVI